MQVQRSSAEGGRGRGAGRRRAFLRAGAAALVRLGAPPGRARGAANDRIRVAVIDPAGQRFVGDAEADRLLTRPYRAPFVVPGWV